MRLNFEIVPAAMGGRQLKSFGALILPNGPIRQHGCG